MITPKFTLSPVEHGFRASIFDSKKYESFAEGPTPSVALANLGCKLYETYEDLESMAGKFQKLAEFYSTSSSSSVYLRKANELSRRATEYDLLYQGTQLRD